MNYKVVLLIILTSLSGFCNISASKIKLFNFQAFIDTELEKGNKNITIPAGQYRVEPFKRQHLLLENLRNVTIDATGVEMICTQTTRAITINNCENLTIKGLTIDYDPLCFTQGTITRLAPDKSYLEFKLHDSYPDNMVVRAEIFNAKTGLLRRHTYYGWQAIEKIGNRTYRLSKALKYKFNPTVDTEEVGDMLVVNNQFAPNGSIPHAVYSDYCENLRLENITLYSGPTFAFFETNGTKNTYYRCVVDRRPEKTDFVKRTMRYRSNNADAFHSKYAFVGPQIIECSAQFQGDDGVNICGIYYFVVSSHGNKINLISHREMALSENSVLDGITSTGERIPAVKVIGVKETANLSDSDKALIKNYYLHENIKKELLSSGTKVYEITLDNPVSVDYGTLISDKNRTGNGFLVKNCNFSNNRSRGILIKGSNGSVDGNILNGNWLHSILISPEAFWLESGCSDNVIVTGNVISNNVSRECILVDATCISGKTPPIGIHHQISIQRNTITNSPVPVVKCLSTNELLLKDNLLNGFLLDENKDVKLINCELKD